MTRITRWLGLALVLSLFVTLLNPQPAAAIAPNAPKTGMVCTAPAVHDVYNLVAKTGYIQTPDGNSIFMWSYANADAPDSGQFQSPGPILCVNQNDNVTIHLHNILPEAVSLIFPGQDAQVNSSGTAGLLTSEAATNGDATYTFTASQPGTYVYQSGSDMSKQVEMGLYGALIVRPAMGANFAYNDASTQFDPSREYMLLLAEIDPLLHHSIETGGVSGVYDFNALHNRYFTINGRSFPDTIQVNGTALLPTQPYGALVRLQPFSATSNPEPALIRMLNVGAVNHPFHPHGNHTREIAKDGRMILSPGGGDASTEHFNETIGAGETEDFLMRWDDLDFWDPNTNPLPVTLPNYRNLDFKDANTFYSGNPYLGYKGTLPTGTTSQNICGEWYFPFHSHALYEFTNYDEGFGGMGTLLRVDPLGGCFGSSTSTTLLGGVLKSGSYTALAQNDSTYYQVNPKTTTRNSATTNAQTSITVTSAAGFPTTAGFYIRIDNEVMQVTAGQGTTTWTVARGQLGTTAAAHANGAVITALATDWYASFSGLPAGALNLKLTYQGENCGSTTGATCMAIASNAPMQTVMVCNWYLAPSGCSTLSSVGWVTLPAAGWTGPAQPQSVGSADLSSTWTFSGVSDAYIGTGAYKGQVRLLIHTTRWTGTNPGAFSTWGNFMKIVYDAP